VYHHWDSYPEGLGTTLAELYATHFAGDLSKMLKTLIDDHPAGWSTINGADFSLEPGFIERPNAICALCGKTDAEHWEPMEQVREREKQDPNTLRRHNWLGHEFQEKDEQPPLCYCHGDRKEEGWEVTEENASGSGVEYVYAFWTEGATHKMAILSSYRKDGVKMIGAFGMGDPDAGWRPIGLVSLNGENVTQELAEAVSA
jgi:hypothetical protein